MNESRALAILAMICVLAGCMHRTAPTSIAAARAPAPSAHEKLRQDAAPTIASVESALDAIAAMRGLSMATRPRVEFVDDAAFAAECAEDERVTFARLTADPRWRGPAPSAAVPPDECPDLAALYTHEDRVIIRRSSYERTGRGWQIQIVAHELEHAIIAHALPPLPSPTTPETVLAFRALQEGDASLTALIFLAKLWGKPFGEAIAERLARIAREEPKSLRDPKFYAYSLGTRFVYELYKHGGFRAVDDAFAHPPTSAAQILHIERYLSPGPPAPNVVTRLPLPAPFVPLFSAASGELGARSLLSYCVMVRVVIAWRSEAAARRFAEIVGGCVTAQLWVAQKGTITVGVTGLDGNTARRYADEVLADVLSPPRPPLP